MGTYLVTWRWDIRYPTSIEVPAGLIDSRRHHGGERRDTEDAAEVAFVRFRAGLAEFCGLGARDRQGGDAGDDLGAQRCGRLC